VVRSRRRIRRICRRMAEDAQSRVTKARIEMAIKTCMQQAKDSKARGAKEPESSCSQSSVNPEGCPGGGAMCRLTAAEGIDKYGSSVRKVHLWRAVVRDT